MARGWESKSVEEQIEAAERRRPNTAPIKSAEERRLEQERASIELTRKRVLRDLTAATHPRYQEQLKAALRHLDEKLQAAGASLPKA